MKENDEIITPEEASKYLKVNVRTIYRWAHTGQVPAIRAGRQWRFRKTELIQSLEKKAKPRKRFRRK